MNQLIDIQNVECGNLIEAVNEAIQETAQDVIRRPHKNEARVVTMTLKIKPKIEEADGPATINQPEIDWSVAVKVPGRKGMTTRAFIIDDKMIVNTGLPMGGNPNQSTLFDQ